MKTSKRLIIVEGPPNSGKTQLANALWEVWPSTHYVHLGPLPRVGAGLARFYVDAMMPAVLGYADVVMDRAWLSERLFRHGVDRLGARLRILERLAWRCQTLVVRCLGPFDQLGYGSDFAWGSLPRMAVDPIDGDDKHNVARILHALTNDASIPHSLSQPTAGNLNGKVLLVGEGYGAKTDADPLYSWPFGSLSGCSLWLAEQLEEGGISERDLYWVNADGLTANVARLEMTIVALGAVAAERLVALGRMPDAVAEHPQAWMHFHHNEEYPLAEMLRGLISG